MKPFEELFQRLPAVFESTRVLSLLAGEYALKADLGEQAAFHCRLAVDEASTNIVEHAYKGDREGEIEVIIRVGDGYWEMHLVDFGESFDPSSVSMPNPGRPIDNIDPGGLGLHLMKQVLDELRYESGEDGNRVVMIKRRT